MRRFIDLYGYARLIRCVAEKFTQEPQWMTERRNILGRGILEKEKRITGGRPKRRLPASEKP